MQPLIGRRWSFSTSPVLHTVANHSDDYHYRTAVNIINVLYVNKRTVVNKLTDHDSAHVYEDAGTELQQCQLARPTGRSFFHTH